MAESCWVVKSFGAYDGYDYCLCADKMGVKCWGTQAESEAHRAAEYRGGNSTETINHHFGGPTWQLPPFGTFKRVIT